MEYLHVLMIVVVHEFAKVSCLTHTFYVDSDGIAELQCPERSKIIPTTWMSSKFEFPIADGQNLNTNFIHRAKYSVTGDFSNGEYNLRIFNIALSDQGIYSCIIMVDGKPAKHEINLILKRPPTNMKIQDISNKKWIYGTEGNELVISCSVTSGAPPEILTWVHENITVASGGPGQLQYYLNASRQNNLQHYTCVADSGVFSPIRATVQLNITYKPSVSIHDNETINITEGKHLQIICAHNSNPLSEMIIWKRISSTQIYIVGNKSTYEIPVATRRDSGTYRCEVSNSIGIGLATVEVNVQYPPKIRIDSKNYTQIDEKRKLECKADGNPNTYTFYRWVHTSILGDHIRYLYGDQNGTLFLPNVVDEDKRYQDSGYYTCTVSNGVIDINGKVNQSEAVYVNVQGRPSFLMDNPKTFYVITGEAHEMSFRAFSDPKYSSIRLEDESGNSRGSMKDFDLLIDDAVMTDNFFGSYVRYAGYRVTLTFSRLTTYHIKNYTLTLSNVLGEKKHDFSILLASRPATPLLLSVKPLTHDLLVEWEIAFDGGLKQTFVIDFQLDGDAYWSSVESYNTSQNDQLSWKVSGLQQGRYYLIKMFSWNKLGRSNTTDVVKVKTKGSYLDASIFRYTTISGFTMLFIVIVTVISARFCNKTKCLCFRGRDSLENSTHRDQHLYDEIADDQMIPNIVQIVDNRQEERITVPNERTSNSNSNTSDHSKDNDDAEGYLVPYNALTVGWQSKSKAEGVYRNILSKNVSNNKVLSNKRKTI